MKEFRFRTFASLPVWAGVLLTLAVLAGCTSDQSTRGTGVVTTTLSDPPTCKGPLAAPSSPQLESVWVTITRVRAHISPNADGNDGGWEDLVDRTDNPLQIDLLDTSSTECILATLSSVSGLPPGNYQQIRLHLLSNDADPADGPLINECGPGGFNCVELAGGMFKILELSSQAQTGFKIPPGRIAGGAISLEAGQVADINIEFNACNSLVRRGNGEFRLLPALHAGEVSLVESERINGRVVLGQTMNDQVEVVVDGGNPVPLPSPATIIVLAEQPDGEGIDRVIAQTLADPADGTFVLCPLPEGNYDIVAAAIDDNDVIYNATITFGVNVPTVTDMGDIPLVPESGTAPAPPGTIEGAVTSRDAGGAVEVDVSLSALQEADSVLVTIPLFGNSTPNVATVAPDSCPTGTACADYTLNVPASNPTVGTFDAGVTTYLAPADPPVLYLVNAQAFEPGTTTPTCAEQPSQSTTDVTVTAGATITAQILAFTGC